MSAFRAAAIFAICVIVPLSFATFVHAVGKAADAECPAPNENQIYKSGVSCGETVEDGGKKKVNLYGCQCSDSFVKGICASQNFCEGKSCFSDGSWKACAETKPKPAANPADVTSKPPTPGAQGPAPSGAPEPAKPTTAPSGSLNVQPENPIDTTKTELGNNALPKDQSLFEDLLQRLGIIQPTGPGLETRGSVPTTYEQFQNNGGIQSLAPPSGNAGGENGSTNPFEQPNGVTSYTGFNAENTNATQSPGWVDTVIGAAKEIGSATGSWLQDNVINPALAFITSSGNTSVPPETESPPGEPKTDYKIPIPAASILADWSTPAVAPYLPDSIKAELSKVELSTPEITFTKEQLDSIRWDKMSSIARTNLENTLAPTGYSPPESMPPSGRDIGPTDLAAGVKPTLPEGPVLAGNESSPGVAKANTGVLDLISSNVASKAWDGIKSLGSDFANAIGPQTVETPTQPSAEYGSSLYDQIYKTGPTNLEASVPLSAPSGELSASQLQMMSQSQFDAVVAQEGFTSPEANNLTPQVGPPEPGPANPVIPVTSEPLAPLAPLEPVPAVENPLVADKIAPELCSDPISCAQQAFGYEPTHETPCVGWLCQYQDALNRGEKNVAALITETKPDSPGDSSPYLAGQRAGLMAELDTNPVLRDRVAAVIAKEMGGGGPGSQAVLESMVNRSVMNGYTSLKQAIDSGFYGPVNTGAVDAYVNGGVSAADRAVGDQAIAAVSNGSNVCNFCTDQGMINEIEGPKWEIGGEYFGYMNGSSGWSDQQRNLQAAYDTANNVAGINSGGAPPNFNAPSTDVAAALPPSGASPPTTYNTYNSGLAVETGLQPLVFASQWPIIESNPVPTGQPDSGFSLASNDSSGVLLPQARPASAGLGDPWVGTPVAYAPNIPTIQPFSSAFQPPEFRLAETSGSTPAPMIGGGEYQGLQGGVFAELSPIHVLTQPILTGPLESGPASPVGPVVSSELPPITTEPPPTVTQSQLNAIIEIAHSNQPTLEELSVKQEPLPPPASVEPTPVAKTPGEKVAEGFDTMKTFADEQAAQEAIKRQAEQDKSDAIKEQIANETLKKDLEDTKSKIADAEAEKKQLEQDKSDAVKEQIANETLKKDLGDTQNKIADAEAEKKQLEQDKSDAVKEKIADEARKKELEAKKIALEKDIERLKNLPGAQKLLAQAQAGLAEMRKKEQPTEQQKAIMRSGANAISQLEKIARAAGETSLADRLKNYSGQLGTLGANAAKFDKLIEASGGIISAALSPAGVILVAKLTTGVDSAIRTGDSVLPSVQGATSRMSNSIQSTISGLQSNVSQINNQISTYAQSISSLTSAGSQLDTQIADLDQSIASLRSTEAELAALKPVSSGTGFGLASSLPGPSLNDWAKLPAVDDWQSLTAIASQPSLNLPKVDDWSSWATISNLPSGSSGNIVADRWPTYDLPPPPATPPNGEGLTPPPTTAPSSPPAQTPPAQPVPLPTPRPGSAPQPPESAPTPANLSLQKNYELGDVAPKGADDIKNLQKFLNSQTCNKCQVATSGYGSPGNETDVFGGRTYRALIAFQRANGLPANGYLGPLTRNLINRISSK